MNIQFKTGEVILLQDSGDGSSRDLLDAIWMDEELDVLKRDNTCGIEFQGRKVEDWNKVAWRKRITYLRGFESPLLIHAGAAAGWIQGRSDRSRHMQASAITGVAKIINSLPQGPGTLLVGEQTLTDKQWGLFALCRAMTFSDRDIVLLDLCQLSLNEECQQKIFDFLKSIIRKDQVIIVASCRVSAASQAQQVIHI